MKINPEAVQIGCAVLIPVGGVLFSLRVRLLQIFAFLLMGLTVLEIVFMMLPAWAAGLWWTIHLPSTLILGGDEILERHGVWISTIAHLGDLILLSMAGTIPVAIRFGLSKVRDKSKQVLQQKDNPPTPTQ